MQNIHDHVYFMNSVEDYLISLAIILGGILVVKIARQIVKKKLAAINNVYVKYLLNVEGFAYPVVFLLVIYGGIQWLVMPDRVDISLNYVFTVALIFLIIRLITAAIRIAVQSYLVEQDDTGGKLKQVRGIILILNGALWIIGLIFLFDNLGFNVTAVITGLGVGGIAIALAAQTILGDIFNYFVIFFDKPFELGDFIVVDDKLGTVEYIGLKTTRIKSLQGEQIVFSNSNLTNSRIHNYKRMLERRVLFKLAVVYETSSEKLSEIPGIVKSIIEKQEETRFDRAHFSSFSEYSLTIEVVYYVLSPDYNQYMNIQEKINLSIYSEFAKRGIKFAIPTYSISMRNAANGKAEDPKQFSSTHQHNG